MALTPTTCGWLRPAAALFLLLPLHAQEPQEYRSALREIGRGLDDLGTDLEGFRKNTPPDGAKLLERVRSLRASCTRAERMLPGEALDAHRALDAIRKAATTATLGQFAPGDLSALRTQFNGEESEGIRALLWPGAKVQQWNSTPPDADGLTAVFARYLEAARAAMPVLEARLEAAPAPDTAEFDRGVDALVAALVSNDPAARKAARESLQALVAAHPAAARRSLPARAAREEDPELKVTFRQALAVLASYADLDFSLVLPEGPASLRTVNSSSFAFAIRIGNRSPEPVRLWRNFRIEIYDERGLLLDNAHYIGHGMRSRKCLLEESGLFIEIGGGSSLDLAETLRNYGSVPRLQTGFQLPAPGRYTIRLTHHFDRAAFIGRCKGRGGCDPGDHASPAAPWNRALEGFRGFEGTLTVTADAPADVEELRKVREQLEAWIRSGDLKRIVEERQGALALLSDAEIEEAVRRAKEVLRRK